MTNETKPTPGPWIADDNEGFSPWAIWSRMTPTGSGKPGPKIAQVVGDSAETDANARLIAAAPDLLEALQMAKHIVANEGTDEQMAQVFSAIEKATGEKA